MAFLDDLDKATQMFQTGVQQIQLQRALSNANEQVQQIKDSELDQTKQMQAIRSVAQNLTLGLSAQGIPASHIEQMSNALSPKVPTMQNAEEAALYGKINQRPDIAQAGQEQIAQKQAFELQKAQISHNTDLAKMKMLLGEQKTGAIEFDKYAKVAPDLQVRSAVGQASLNSQAANKLTGLFGENPSIQQLNKANPQFVAEGATALARMLAQGQITNEEIDRLLPSTFGRTAAEKMQYVSNHPEAANMGEFLNLYLKSAKNENEVAQQALYRNILDQGQGHIHLTKYDEDQFKQMTSQRLRDYAGLNVDASQIQIGKNKKLDVILPPDQEKNVTTLLDLAKKAKLALKGTDENRKADAQKFLQQLQVDPNKSISSIESRLRFRFLQGKY